MELGEAIERAVKLSETGDAWAALACLQDVDIEAVVLRLVEDDLASMPRSEREQAVGHAVTKLYELWAKRERVVSVLGFLKTTCRRKARDLNRGRQGPDEPYDAGRHEVEIDEDPGDDPVSRRTRAVALARDLLPKLGLPSVIDTMSAFLDRVAAGDDASPRALADFLDVPYSTVTTHLDRGLRRLEQRLQGSDVQSLFDALEHDVDEEE